MRAMQAIAAVLIASFLSQSASAQTGVQHAPAKPDRAKTNAAPVQTPPPAAPAEHPLDIAYGSFQRGYFITAFSLATDRVTNAGDPKAMTLLGELYANGLGVPLDYQRAAEWYRLAAARGDSNAMFALAMFALNGRAGPRDRQASTQWLAAAAKLGHPIAAYDLALLYIEGQMFPQDFSRAAELLRVAAQGGSPDAQYALGTFYKAGRGVPQDMHQAVQWWAQAALADNTDAQVEYAIALYNGDGVAPNQEAATALFHKAAIAQDRLARILASGRGAPVNLAEAAKWHLISRAGGETDLELDDMLDKLDPQTRAAAQKAAKPWLDAIAAAQQERSTAQQAQQAPAAPAKQ
jgi:TPR repeat protein